MTGTRLRGGNGRRFEDDDVDADALADLTDAIENGEDPTSAEYSVAFTPRNVAVGLAIVAGLVAFALSRRRRGQARGRGPDGDG